MIVLGFHFNLPVTCIYFNVLLFVESLVGSCIIKINLSLPLYCIIESGRKSIPRLPSKIHQTVEQDCRFTNYCI